MSAQASEQMPEAGAGGLTPEATGVVRDAAVVGLVTGAYGLSFGAVSTTAGLTLAQTAAMSLLMFTGASQFALVGVVAGGGVGPLAALSATLLGLRNALYGLRLSSLLRPRGLTRLLAAHLTIDESFAMASARGDRRAARLAFWATGVSVFVLWNLATVLGALAARALPDPRVLGLDVAAPAAFLALLAPQVRGRGNVRMALAAAVLAVALTPIVPRGVPIIVVAAGTVLAGLLAGRRTAGTA